MEGGEDEKSVLVERDVRHAVPGDTVVRARTAKIRAHAVWRSRSDLKDLPAKICFCPIQRENSGGARPYCSGRQSCDACSEFWRAAPPNLLWACTVCLEIYEVEMFGDGYYAVGPGAPWSDEEHQDLRCTICGRPSFILQACLPLEV